MNKQANPLNPQFSVTQWPLFHLFAKECYDALIMSRTLLTSGLSPISIRSYSLPSWITGCHKVTLSRMCNYDWSGFLHLWTGYSIGLPLYCCWCWFWWLCYCNMARRRDLLWCFECRTRRRASKSLAAKWVSHQFPAWYEFNSHNGVWQVESFSQEYYGAR